MSKIENSPSGTPFEPIKQGVQLRAGSEFTDAQWWDNLWDQHHIPYQQPKWSERCTTKRMGYWLKELNKTETWYKRKTMTSLNEFVDLNPTWPLRAWLGTVMELLNEGNGNKSGNRDLSGQGG